MTYANQDTVFKFRLVNEPEHLFTERIRRCAIRSLEIDCKPDLLQNSRYELGAIATSYMELGQDSHLANYFLNEQDRVHGPVQ